MHHTELEFVLGRATETILSSSVTVVFGRCERSDVCVSASLHKCCRTQRLEHIEIVSNDVSVLTFNVTLRVLPVNEGPLLEFTETSVSFFVSCVSKQNQLGNQNLFFPLQLSATLAIPFWQWFLSRFGKKTAVYAGSLVRPTPLLIQMKPVRFTGHKSYSWRLRKMALQPLRDLF